MLVKEKGDEYSSTLMLGVLFDAVVLECHLVMLTNALFVFPFVKQFHVQESVWGI